MGMFIDKRGKRPVSTSTSQVVTSSKIKRGNIMERKLRRVKKRGGEVGEMSRRFIKRRLKGSNVNGLQIIQRMRPTHNTESVDIKVCYAFPGINHVVCYRRLGCVYKLGSLKLKIQYIYIYIYICRRKRKDANE